MPLYEFECQKCGTAVEKVFKIDDCPKTVRCPVCRGRSRKVISYGGIQCDSINNVNWLPDALKTLQAEHEKPIETRGEHKRYLEKHGMVCKG